MTRAATQAERFDHDRDLRKHEPRPADQRYAVAALVGECESLVASGDLNPSQEASLRCLVARTLAAFQMPSKAEREPA